MKASEAKELFRQMTEKFFPDHIVVFGSQSRMQKQKLPLIVLTTGNVRRPNFPNSQTDNNGTYDGSYESHITVTVDLYTHGVPILDDEGNTAAYSNTAMDEILAFADYMNGQKCLDWCYRNNLSILVEEDAQDMTGIINDTNYEYRARVVVNLSFTQHTEDTIGREDMGAFTDLDVSSHWN